jgi:diguanylate cyclase (GGDEF)-like protein/PAS domain S-box-containing protein
MRLTIARKVLLGMTAILMFAVITAAVIYWGLSVAQRSVTEASLMAPAASVAHEMEANLLQAQLALQNYLDLADPAYRKEIFARMVEFEEYQRHYTNLTRDTLAVQPNETSRALFDEFKELTFVLLDDADTQRGIVAKLTLDASLLNEVIENELQPVLAADGSSRAIEINAAETVAWLINYLWSSEPQHAQQIRENAAAFEQGLRRFKASSRPAATRGAIKKIDQYWSQIKLGVWQALELKSNSERNFKRFIEVRDALNIFVRQQIRQRAVDRLGVSQANSEQAYVTVRMWSIALIPLLLLWSGGVVFIVLRAVRKPAAALRYGAEEIGRGNLDYRLRELGNDEFGDLGRAFNHMASELREITVSKDRLAESEERYREILEQMEEGYYETDLKGNLTFFNPALARMLGYTPEQLRGMNNRTFIDDATAKKVGEIFQQVYTTGEAARDIEVEIIRKDGTRREIWSSAQLMRDPSTNTAIGFRGVQYDVTERKRIERQMAHQALHDALTGLPNRYMFQERLDEAIRKRQYGGRPFALLLFDLDHFKEINDTLGHPTGDVLLKRFGERIGATLRQTDTLARLGGDEFALILPEVDAQQVETVTRKLMKALDAPFDLNGTSIEVRASGGIALCPSHGVAAEDLFKRADIALYVAKQDRSRCVVYSPEQDSGTVTRLTETSELRTAIENNALTLFYQPIVRMSDRRTISMEALVRWPHPVRGMVSPADFIPQAERHGLIKPLTLWCMQTAADKFKELRALGVEVPIAVNFSPVALRDPEFLKDMAAKLDNSALPSNWLECEVTENAVVAFEHLKPLRERGARLHIDDFGTGYSSLSYLRDLHVDVLKIDRSFIKDLGKEDDNDMIVSGIIQLAHSLKIRVVAEGVETQEAWDRLVALGCDAAQGYFITPPMPPPLALAWLQKERSVDTGAKGRGKGGLRLIQSDT